MDFYDRNMEALKKHHPGIAEFMTSVTIDDTRIKVLHAKTGEPRLKYKKDNAEEIYIHSAEDPVKRASSAADVVGKLGHEGIVILFGFGLGYFAEEVLNKFEKSHVLIVYEATPELFKVALRTRNISSLLESDKVKLIIGEKPDDLSALHLYYHLIHNGKFLVVKHHPSIMLNAEAYDTFMQVVIDEKKIVDGQIVTGLSRGREFVDADIDNTPIIMRMQGVIDLKGTFQGWPAIVVSAGPSLDRNFHLLKKAKGKAVIIAVDAALATLLPCGIIPDMVVAVEASKKTVYMFKDNPALKQVPLVALTVFQTDILRMYPGTVFINYTPGNFTSMLFGDYIEEKGYIHVSGGCVAHLAFSVAEFMGCSSIALVGQDLSFNTERFHSEGFAQMLDMLVMDNAFPEKNIFGEDVYTRGDLFMYKISFERKINTFEGKVINATEGGLPIKGAITLRLADFIDEYCNINGSNNVSSSLSNIVNRPISYNLKGILFVVYNLRDKLNQIKKSASRIRKNISRLEAMIKNGQKESHAFHRILNKTEALVEEVKHPALNLMVGYNYKLELYLKKLDITGIDEIEDTWEKLDKQLERGNKYYSEIVKTIRAFNRKLNHLISELKTEDKINAILMDKTIDQNEKFFRAGVLYKNAGIIAQSVKYLESLVNIYSSSSQGEHESESFQDSFSKSHRTDVCIALAETYIRQHRFYEARKVLYELRDIDPACENKKLKFAMRVNELLKICDEKIVAWEERKKKMGKVFADAKANYGGNLETGYFYFRVEDYERAEKAYVKAIMECESTKQSSSDTIKFVEASYGLAHTYLAMNETEKAVETLEKAMETDPSNPLLYRDLGLIAIQNNNIEPAEIFLTKAIELAPDEAELYKPLANLYIGLGKKEKAVALYENAIVSHADNPVIQKDLAMVYKETIEEAEGC